MQEQVKETLSDEEGVRRRRAEARREARRAMGAGVGLVGCSAGLIGLAFVIGRASIDKYIVALGFILMCLGIGLLVNGAWDWRRWR